MAKVTVESVALWMIFAMVTGFVTYLLWKRAKMKASTAIILPILVFYLSFVLTITIFERVPSRRARYELELFWSYRAIASGTTRLIAENFWNIVLFIPIGVLASGLLPRRRTWTAGMICAAVSVAIEVTQLVTHRGLFEWDDIIHNTLGSVIGVGLYLLMRKLGRRGE